MALPTYEMCMLPFLRILEDGKERRFRDVIEAAADHFGLTTEEREQLLPSGNQRAFDNRMGWARTYLKKAGLLEYPKRGLSQITARGKEVLAYLQIVHSVRQGKKVRQQVFGTLGRLDELKASGQLEALIRSGLRHCEKFALIDAHSAGAVSYTHLTLPTKA